MTEQRHEAEECEQMGESISDQVVLDAIREIKAENPDLFLTRSGSRGVWNLLHKKGIVIDSEKRVREFMREGERTNYTMEDRESRRIGSALLRSLAKHRFTQEDNDPVHVKDNVWIGSIGAASNVDALQAKGITHVLSLCSDDIPRHKDILYNIMDDIADNPSTNLMSRLPQLCDFIQASLESETNLGTAAVLVNCFQGKSRSATVVAAFLIRRHGLTVAEALSEVRASRPIADPNLGFLAQLRRWERECREDK